MTIPGHEHLPPEEALSSWTEEFAKGHDLITPFAHAVKDEIDRLISQNIVIENRCAAMGLSRGVFIACHAAAITPSIRTILGFAPLTQLDRISVTPLAESLSLIHLSDRLFNRKIRFYIGNRDSRVGTRLVFDFVESLAEHAHKNRISSPPIELIIGPSIGRQGHGTSPEVFRAGADWLSVL